jgi:hypothetical protein
MFNWHAVFTNPDDTAIRDANHKPVSNGSGAYAVFTGAEGDPVKMVGEFVFAPCGVEAEK